MVLLLTSSVFAQEQAKPYSGFERFADNVRMFFSFGDKRVTLALEIKDKELDSAIVNTKGGDDYEAEKNLKRARERLRFVQSKVSQNTAENVKANIEETIDRINEEGNLPDRFDTYVLEEEKTQLTAELVSKVEEEDGVSLTREIVKSINGGEDRVEVTVEVDDVRPEIMEIEMRIDKIDDIIEASENTVEKGKDQVDTPMKTKDNEDARPQKNGFVDEVDDTFVGPAGPGPGVIDDD